MTVFFPQLGRELFETALLRGCPLPPEKPFCLRRDRFTFSFSPSWETFLKWRHGYFVFVFASPPLPPSPPSLQFFPFGCFSRFLVVSFLTYLPPLFPVNKDLPEL